MDKDTINLWVAIAVTSLAKWLLTEEGPAEGESPRMARIRRRKAFGGIIAGCVVGYYGHPKIIALSDKLTESDSIIVAIVLVLTGEHLFRWMITMGPTIFEKVAARLFGGGK